MSDLTDVASVRSAIAGGRRLSFLFFWGHRAPSEGAIGKWCLSQWWPAPFKVGNRTFATAEHFMMAEKARLFGDRPAEEAILAAADPARAKALGRTVRDFDEGVWRSHRFDIVVRGSRAKVTQHPELGRFLAKAPEDVIVEASPSDTVWGIGMRENDPGARDPRRWRGSNLLGFALMAVRRELRAGDGTER